MNYKISIVRLSSLGDILLTLPLAARLKKNSAATLTWIVDSRFEDALLHFPWIDRVIGINPAKPLKSLLHLKRLHLPQQDLVLDPQGLLKSALIARLLPAKNAVGLERKDSREFSWLLYTRTLGTRALLNVIDKNLCFSEPQPLQKTQKTSSNTAKLAETPFLNSANQAKIFPEAKNSVLKFLEQHTLQKKKILLLFPWSGYHTKNMPKALVSDIIVQAKKQYQLESILVADKSRQHDARQWAEEFGILKAALFGLKEIFALVAMAQLLIASDSGAAYIGWHLKTPSMALFGPTNKFRQSPDFATCLHPDDKKLFCSLLSTYACPIMKKEPIISPYRCLKKDCDNNLCMQQYNALDILKRAEDRGFIQSNS